tara:strand:+ start:674 stop:1555 length:882 start_codon:yes stop_codon:yes gene_type:complete
MSIKIPVASKVSYNKTQTPSKKLIKIPIKKNQAPKPFIDRITLILDVDNKKDAYDIYSNIWAQFDDKETFQFSKSIKGYQVARRIKIPNAQQEKHYPLLQFRFFEKQAVRFRLTFSPVDLDLQCMTEMHVHLQALIPGGWRAFIQRAHATMIEISVDLPSVPICEVHPLPQQTRTVKTYSNNGQLQTLYLGNKKSNQFRIYDRAVKRIAKGQNWEAGECTRVERILRGQKINLLELGVMNNPFSNLNFVDLPALPPPGKQNQYIWPLFCDSVQLRTLPVALKLFPAATKRKEY